MPDHPVDPKSYVILVAEDHPTGLKTVRVTLEKAGYTVIEARDGRTALEKMAHRPHLVIVDLVLPDMSGFELVEQIRDRPGGATVPVIAYCGVMTREEEARSIVVGFTDYLFKPIVPERLLDTVQTYLPPKDSPENLGAGQHLLVVDDDPTHLSMIGARLTRAGYIVVPVLDAAEALAFARVSPPDLILSDALMPKMDGFQFCLAVRGDPALAHVPVVLFSSTYDEDIDRQLARDAGASALVPKSPGFEEIVKAARSALGSLPPPATALPRRLGENYTSRVAQQLDRQIMLNANLRERLMRREAELAVLTTLLDALKRGSISEILGDMLDRIRHAAGVPRGIIYLLGSDGTLEPRAHAGYPFALDQGLRDFFGHVDALQRVLTTKAPAVTSLIMPREILSKIDRAEQSVLFAPILRHRDCGGVLVMSSGTRVLTEELLPFAKTVGIQIGHTLGMIDALAEAERREGAAV